MLTSEQSLELHKRVNNVQVMHDIILAKVLGHKTLLDKRDEDSPRLSFSHDQGKLDALREVDLSLKSLVNDIDQHGTHEIESLCSRVDMKCNQLEKEMAMLYTD